MNLGVRIAGFVLVILGLLAIVMTLFSVESPVNGLTLDTGVVLLAGGVIVLGLSGVMTSIEALRVFLAGEDQAFAASLDDTRSTRTAADTYSPGKRPSPKHADTPRRQEPALQTRAADMKKPAKEPSAPAPEPPKSAIAKPAESVRDAGGGETAPEAVSEEELYVVEERTIAGKPARVLSDGTVEAETDDGWMRFENVEHLEEYMEAVRAQRG
jgi:hypothetical protein